MCLYYAPGDPAPRSCVLVPIVGGWLRKSRRRISKSFIRPGDCISTRPVVHQPSPLFPLSSRLHGNKTKWCRSSSALLFFFSFAPLFVMDYRQLLLNQANALAAAGCYGSAGTAGSPAGYPSAAATSAAAAAAAAYSHAAARTYSYRLWTLANVLSDPCMHS